jgi:hypothetical protein
VRAQPAKGPPGKRDPHLGDGNRAGVIGSSRLGGVYFAGGAIVLIALGTSFAKDYCRE